MELDTRLVRKALLSSSSRRDEREAQYMSEPAVAKDEDWRRHLIEDMRGIRRVLEETRRIAVLGIKIEESGAPAFYVAEYVQHAGYEIVPVPVYYPDCREILGEKVYRTVSAIPDPIDMVNVFRRPHKIPEHVNDIIRKRPKSVWFQLGIRNDAAAEQLARAGIDVVQDRCLMVELQHIGK
jgi:predicted CoA-binding protein